MRPPPPLLPQRCLIAAVAAVVLQLVLLGGPQGPAVLLEGTSYVTLHLLLELFSVMVSVMIVAVSWHAQGARRRDAASAVVAGFTVVATCDLLHALTYDGMPPFLGPVGTPRAIFFWLMARSAEAVVVLLLLTPLARAGTRGRALALGLAVSAGIVAWGSTGMAGFPVTFEPGRGVTPFKSSLELAICAANLLAAALWWRRARSTDPGAPYAGDPRAYLLATASWIIGIGELSFTHYLQPSDFQNMFGHAYKLVGYLLLYRISVVSNVVRPFEEADAARAAAEDAARQLRLMGDNLPNSFLYQLERRPDGQLRFRHVGEAVQRLTGVPVAEVLEDPTALARQRHPQDVPLYEAAAHEAIRTLRPLDVSYRIRHRDGGWRWIHLVSAPRQLGDGTTLWDALASDVTEAREAEMRHRENEAMLAAVIDSASDAIVSTDGDGRITLFNPAAERIFGHPAAALLGQPLDRLLPPGDAPRHAQQVAAFSASGASPRRMGAGRVKGRHADGGELELEASISQVVVNERRVLTAILRDVTERVRTERALLQSQLELTELAHRLMAQEQQTTRRLAQTLHDRLGQTLTAMRIDFVAEAPPSDPVLAARHARVDRLIDQAVREVREALVELRPTLLEDHGLAEALHNEIQQRRSAAQGVAVELLAAAGADLQRWPADVEYAAFMVAREALANALQHARPARVTLRLEGGPRWLRLQVQDDGRGPAPTGAAARPGHLGMVGMRERSIAIGARFEVGAAPGGGTLVELHWEDPR